MTTEPGPRPIAVMAYTVLEQAKADLGGTLAKVAAMGYLGIETYGLVEHFGPERVRNAIADVGLQLTSAHTPFPAGPNAERILDENAALGARVLVWSMEPEEFNSPESIRVGLARINEAAEHAARRGMVIAYHNHLAEFSRVFGGRRAYDLLLEQLDPRVVVEFDAYWTQVGGAHPADVLHDLGHRAHLIHIKDGPAISYEDDIMVPIGEGQIDWRETLETPSGLEWHIVELERLHVDTFDALQRSYDHLVGRGLSRGSVTVAPVAS